MLNVSAGALLDDAVAQGITPCAVAEAGDTSAVRWRHATGRLSSSTDAPVAGEDTLFDLASLTKVLATSTIAMRLVQAEALGLNDRVSARMPPWQGSDRRDVTLADLLEHASGLPGHRDYYLRLAGRDAFVEAICHEPLVCPPRTQSLYSDLGFILLGVILERVAGDTLDHLFAAFWRQALPSVPPPAYTVGQRDRARVAPTGHDPWRGRELVAEVHDENAAALGGVAAHAGLFGTAASVGAFARWMLARLRGADDATAGVSAATARRFAAPSRVPHSSRAFGWDLMRPTSSCGRRFSPSALGHTGFTGTSLWLDPVLDRYVVLLTNRVHPTRANEGIRTLRPAFHEAVLQEI